MPKTEPEQSLRTAEDARRLFGQECKIFKPTWLEKIRISLSALDPDDLEWGCV